MKALIAILFLASVFSFTAVAGEIPRLLPLKRSPDSVSNTKSKSKKQTVLKKKKTKIVSTKSKSKSKAKPAKLAKSKGSKKSTGRSSTRRTVRTTASASHASVEQYFSKETLSQAEDSSESLPARAKVGIKHSVRAEE